MDNKILNKCYPCQEIRKEMPISRFQAQDMVDQLYMPSDTAGNVKAKQRRYKFDACNGPNVFPRQRKGLYIHKEDYKTHYGINFTAKKNAKPSSPRPCSPTRRNNPHPLQVKIFCGTFQCLVNARASCNSDRK